MPKLSIGATERWLIVVLCLMVMGLSLTTQTFRTFSNIFDLLNTNAVDIVFGVGLLVVLATRKSAR